MKKRKLDISTLKVSTFKTSPDTVVKRGGELGGTITDCLCSETFWVPCDCGGCGCRSEPDWVCRDQRY